MPTPPLVVFPQSLLSFLTCTLAGLLAVYALEATASKNKDNFDHIKLILQYQHALSRSAHSLLVGPFGGSKKDILCVQSLDGALNVFEQESYAFSRFLPGFLLPGPLVYTERTDSFITLTSAYQLESYRCRLNCDVYHAEQFAM